MKNKSIPALLFLIMVIVLSACSQKVPEKVSYRMSTGEETWNVVEISEKTKEGFYLEASCCNQRLNLGEFKGGFKFESPDVAVFYGENYDGIDYIITAEFSGDNLLISVKSYEECAEFALLGFGMNVYLSGKYVKK